MEKADRTRAGDAPWWWLAGRFLLAFIALQMLYASSLDSAAERFLVETITAGSAAWFIGHIDSHIAVLAIGREIIAPCGALSILNGCDGSEALLLLAAAISAAPVSCAWRIVGLLAALPFVYVVNQMRLVALFFAYCRARESFAFLHGYAAPSAIVIACCLFLLVWLQLGQTRTNAL